MADHTDGDRLPPTPSLAGIPASVLAHVIDVHCHPTDSDPDMTASVVANNLPIRICAMATRRSDQSLVKKLAQDHPDKVIPCFGYHPWFTHWIHLGPQPGPSKEDHYRALFLPSSAQTNGELAASFARLLPFLPDPIALSDVLADLRDDLSAVPNAMLGEVGIDRVCRIPYTHPAEPPFASEPSSRELSPFTIPLDHQLAVLEAQLALAVELKRNVSMHSVKCQQATGELLDRMAVHHGARWLRISLDLHSCGLSAQTWSAIEKKHPNVFLSLSTAINARSPAHKALIAACSPHRIMVESDFHDVRLSGPYTWQMLCTVAEVKGWVVEDVWDPVVPQEEWGAVRRLEENWRAFEKGDHTPYVRRKQRRDRAIEEWEEEQSD